MKRDALIIGFLISASIITAVEIAIRLQNNHIQDTKTVKTLTCYYNNGDMVSWKGSDIKYSEGAFYLDSKNIVTGNCFMSQGETK